MFDIMMDFDTNKLVQQRNEGFEHPFSYFEQLISNVGEGWGRYSLQRSTVKPTFTSSIHTNQQLECVTLVQWTSAVITRLTTFKVTRFSSSFSIPTCESISAWATLKMFRKLTRQKLLIFRLTCSPFIFTI